MSLDEHYDLLLENFRKRFEELQTYAHEVLKDGIEVKTSWKVHVLVCHLGQWLVDKTSTGFGFVL